MTQRVLAAAGRDDLQPVVLAEARHEIPNQYLAATKLRDRLGWSPSVGLEEGLTRTVRWYRTQAIRQRRSGKNITNRRVIAKPMPAPTYSPARITP